MSAEFLMVSCYAPMDGHGAEPRVSDRVMCEIAWARIQAAEIPEDLIARLDPWYGQRPVDPEEEVPEQDDFVQEEIGVMVGALLRGVLTEYAVEWDDGRRKFVTGGISHGEPPTAAYDAVSAMSDLCLWDEPVTEDEIERATLAASVRSGR